MKLLKQIPETAMVADFLKAEFTSPRFSADVKKAMRSVGVEEPVVTHPDVESSRENELRAKVLSACRGYRENREMFVDVPDNLTWYEAEISRDEIGNLRYVDYSYWNELTDDTHLVRDGVKNIGKGKIVFDVPHDRFLEFAEKIRRGGNDFGPIIIWGQAINSPLQILEGHLRATALGLAADKAPATVRALVGFVNAPKER